MPGWQKCIACQLWFWFNLLTQMALQMLSHQLVNYPSYLACLPFSLVYRKILFSFTISFAYNIIIIKVSIPILMSIILIFPALDKLFFQRNKKLQSLVQKNNLQKHSSKSGAPPYRPLHNKKMFPGVLGRASLINPALKESPNSMLNHGNLRDLGTVFEECLY